MEILYFEATDEVTKAIERIKATDDKELALVLPTGSLILQGIVNLKLIQRIAKTSNKKIVIVTVDKIGRNLATQIGIPVYGKIENGKAVGKLLQKTPQPVTPQALRNQIQNETDELTTITGIQVHRYDKDNPLNRLDGQNEAPSDSGAAPDLASRGKTVTHMHDATGKEHAEPGFSIPKMPKNIVKYLVWLLVVAAIAAAGWLYWAFPKVNIILNLESEEHQTETNVNAVGEDKTEGDIDLTVTTLEKTGSKTVPATGSKDIGEKASGNITLVNQYSTNSQAVPAGSLLVASGGMRFVTTTGVVIPGADITVEGSTNTLNKSGRVQVAIVAENPGAQYNLESGRLTIEGITDGKDGKVFAESPSTSGGLSETRTVVAATDIENAKNDLMSELTNQATDEALSSLSSGDVIDEATSSNIVSFSTDANENDERAELTVTTTVAVNLLAIDQDQLKQVIADEVNAQLDSDKEFTVAENGLNYTIKSLNVAQKKLTLSVSAQGNIVAKLDKEQLRQSLLGKSRKEAERLLGEVPFYQSSEFSFDPRWFIKRIAPANQSLELKVQYK